MNIIIMQIRGAVIKQYPFYFAAVSRRKFCLCGNVPHQIRRSDCFRLSQVTVSADMNIIIMQIRGAVIKQYPFYFAAVSRRKFCLCGNVPHQIRRSDCFRLSQVTVSADMNIIIMQIRGAVIKQYPFYFAAVSRRKFCLCGNVPHQIRRSDCFRLSQVTVSADMNIIIMQIRGAVIKQYPFILRLCAAASSAFAAMCRTKFAVLTVSDYLRLRFRRI